MTIARLDAAYPDEHDLVYCDWSELIGDDDSISSADASTIVDKNAVDATPSARLSGSPIIIAPSKTAQWVTTLQDGAEYLIGFKVQTASGRRLKEYCRLKVKAA
jgi:hypothetical protein